MIIRAKRPVKKKGDWNMEKLSIDTRKKTVRFASFASAAVLCLVLALSLAAPGCKGGKGGGKDAGKKTGEASKAGDKVVVKMEKGGSDITLKDLDDAWEREVPDMNKSQLMNMPGWQKQFVDYWVNMAVLAERAKTDKLTDEEEYKTMMKTAEVQILAALYLKKKITPKLDKINASEADAQEYYNKHKEEFYRGWREISQIIVPTEQEAKAIYAQVSAKPEATFAAIAKAKSKDQATAANGGYVGKVFRGQANVLPEIEKAAATAVKGSVISPLKTQWGWAVVYIKNASTPQEDYMPFDGMFKEQIRSKVEQDKKMAEFEKIVKSLKKELGVKVDDKAVPQVGEAWRKKLEEAMQKAAPHGMGGASPHGGAAPQGGASPHGR